MFVRIVDESHWIANGTRSNSSKGCASNEGLGVSKGYELHCA